MERNTEDKRNIVETELIRKWLGLSGIRRYAKEKGIPYERVLLISRGRLLDPSVLNELLAESVRIKTEREDLVNQLIDGRKGKGTVSRPKTQD